MDTSSSPVSTGSSSCTTSTASLRSYTSAVRPNLLCAAAPYSENANCRQFTILHKNGAHMVLERPNACSEAVPALVVGADRPMLVVIASCACYR
jgi:hypothetical protein